MYRLSLSLEERRAIDFVGHRYATGDELYLTLWGNSVHVPDNIGWAEEGDILFQMHEYVAWAIMELAEQEEFRWPLFSKELAAKMQHFVDTIV